MVLVGLAAVVALAALAPGLASAGNRKLVEGTVYDTTCATTCEPECPPPPHCGPIPVAGAGTDIVCAQRLIVCPPATSPRICLQGSPCGRTIYPLYSGEGAVVKVRKRGSATVIATVPIVEGHFETRLAPGAYMVRPFLPEPQCWSGTKIDVLVTPTLKGPVPAHLWVTNSCVAHPDR
jgi:hypothetical protein